jgi:hypothetical protein
MENQSKSIKEKYFGIVRELTPVERTGYNPHAKSKYAKLSAVQAELKPILEVYRCIIHIDMPEFQDEVYTIPVVLEDVDSDEKMTWVYKVPIDNRQSNRVQAFGSTTTYLQRYCLCMSFQIPLDDEDPDSKSQPAPATQQSAQAALRPKLQPFPVKEQLVVGSDKYNAAVKWLSGDGNTLPPVEKKYEISDKVRQQLIDDAANYEQTKESK